MKKVLFVIAVVAAAVCTGCMTVDLGASLETPVSMSGAPAEDYTVVRHFEQKDKAWFTLFDLATVENPDVSNVLATELKRTPGDAVINVQIQGQTTFIDGLIPIAMSLAGTLAGQALASDPYSGAYYGSILGTLAGAMLSAMTYTVSGDIIKYD
jgi:hypothetical protein